MKTGTATYLTAIFGACQHTDSDGVLCGIEYGHVYDQDAVSVQEAREALTAKIAACEHNGLGKALL